MGCAFANSQCDRIQTNQKMLRSARKSQKIDSRRKSTYFSDTITENVNLLEQNLTPETIKFAETVLKSHYLFSSLDSGEINKIIQHIVISEAQISQYVFRQGEKGNSFFIIDKGAVIVQINGEQQKILKRGDSFGELALIYSTLRNASIKCCQEDTRLLIIRPGILRKILKQINTKNYQKMFSILQKVQSLTFLTNKQKIALINAMIHTNYNVGEIIFNQNDLSLAFYIIIEGSVSIEIIGKESVVLRPGDSFGESSFLEAGRRMATAIARQSTKCLSISKNKIQQSLGNSFNHLMFFNIQKWALRRSQIFKNLSNRDIDKISSQFKLKYAKNHQIIMETNKPPQGLIICLEGKINNQNSGHIFFQENFRKTDLALTQPLVKQQPGFYSYLEFNRLNDLFNKLSNTRRRNSKLSLESNQKENIHPISVNNFQYIKKLGQGQFGHVFLVKDPTLGGATFALKCLSKEAIEKQGMQNCVISQKRILESITFFNIVGFVKAFSDKKHIYFLTEFIQGTQLFDVLRQIGVLNKTIARYFFASLLLPIQYLHSLNIVYRDLKPQNSVVNYNGKVYLIDLGTAKILKSENMYRTFTIIGTPHYLAPEVMQGKGYSFEVDYWSLGVLLYEFLCARLPFGQHLNDPYAIYAEVMRNQVIFPKFYADDSGKKLIKKLLTRNIAGRRLEGGFQQIKQSTFFEDFSWDNLAQEKMTPAYIPKKFRGTVQNYAQLEGIPFLSYLYKSNLKGSKSGNTVLPTVSEWNQNFTE